MPAEHNALARVPRGTFDEPASVAERLGCDQDPFGVPAFEDVPEAHSFRTHEIVRGNFQVLNEDLGRVVVEHRLDRSDRDAPIGHSFPQIHDEDREPLGLVLEVLIGRGARKQQHEVGVLRARDEDLLAVHHVAVAFPDRSGPEPRRLGAGFGLGDTESLQADLPFADAFHAVLMERLHLSEILSFD